MANKKSRENEVKFAIKSIADFNMMYILYNKTPNLTHAYFLKQAYIFNDDAGVARIRHERLLDAVDSSGKLQSLRNNEQEAFILTIKGNKVFKDGRVEVERGLSEEEFMSLFTMSLKGSIQKHRFNITVDLSTGKQGVLSVDVFSGENRGLCIAELEFEGEEVPTIINPPEWLGDVVDDPKLFNSNLLTHPFSNWTKEERAVYLVE